MNPPTQKELFARIVAKLKLISNQPEGRKKVNDQRKQKQSVEFIDNKTIKYNDGINIEIRLLKLHYLRRFESKLKQMCMSIDLIGCFRE